MADQRLEEYRSYYDARAERYANNPNRKYSYDAECGLRQLFYDHDTFEAMVGEAPALSQACAFASWRDQYEMESRYYGSVNDPVRKKCADQILSQLDTTTDLNSMMAKTGEITNANSVEIMADEESGKALLENWKKLDDIEAFANAEVPGIYKGYMVLMAEEKRKEINESVHDTEKTVGDWIHGWRLRPETALEYRYRHLMPYSDDEVEQHLIKLKEITNR